MLLVGNFLSGSKKNQSVCEDLAIRLSAAGWSVITTSRNPGRVTRLINMVATAWRRRNEYTLAQVDVFSGPAFLWAEAACATIQRAGKPYVLTLRGGGLPAFAERWPRRVGRLLQSAAAVTTPSRYLLEQMSPYRCDLSLLPNPLDLNSYRVRLRENLRPRIVWLRAFHEIYNPSLAPQVISLLVRDFPDVRMTMIGPDKGDGSLQAMKEMADELGVADRIELPGRVAKTAVADWLDKGDIFLNTTKVDNTPVSVMEAMASGLCVVSTDVGGIPYLLEHERDALLVPPGDAQRMAEAVSRLLTEPDLARRLSHNARQKAEQFDWSVMFPQWETLLMSVAGKSQ